jgi:glycosyltransferase involved in cell wall biosynthesis
MAPINQLGYGVASLNILKALQAKVEVSLFPIGQPQVTNQVDAEAVVKAIECSQTFDCLDPCIKIWHQNQMAERIGSGKFIGFPIFELDTFNDKEKHNLKCCDKLFVCSEWARNVCVKNKITDYYKRNSDYHTTKVIPLGVDTDIFKPCGQNESSKTIFYNCGKWEVRKGHDILRQAFDLAFEGIDDVELWMMCQNPFNTPQEESGWVNLYNNSKIRFIPRVKSQQEVYNIMSQVDCGVFPSRAEGWNLEALEMMACGKQVIITNYSAHTEFCNKNNSFLIDIDDVEPAFDNKWFYGHGNWAKISEKQIKQLAEHMLTVYNKKKSGESIINHNGIETAKMFTWEKSVEKILNNV